MPSGQHYSAVSTPFTRRKALPGKADDLLEALGLAAASLACIGQFFASSLVLFIAFLLLSQVEKMTASAKIERRVALAEPGRVFTVDDFSGTASPAAVNTALSRLSKRGALERARRGVYYKPRISRFGRGSIGADHIALSAAHGKAPGPAGASAAAALGLTTQIPSRPTIAVVGNRPVSVPDVRFIERSNLERVKVELRPREVALLEVLRDDLKWVEVPENAVATRLHELVSAGDIDLRRVRRAAKGEPRRVAAKLEALLAG